MPFVDELISVLFKETSTTRVQLHTVGGGCINNTGMFQYKGVEYFLKWNHNAQDLFFKEEKGLSLLSEKGKIKIPSVVGRGTVGEADFLCLEYIRPESRKDTFCENLGQELADLHRCSNSFFGLDFDNHIGRLKQSNKKSKDWSEFLIEERLQPQIELAFGKDLLTQDDRDLFDEFCNYIDNIFPIEAPSLIHGDLWSGNIICGQNQQPYLVDPAVYYGNREMELAFTHLFGGFDQKFYDSYEESFPLTPGFQERIDFYNLYPLLVHLNLFGSSYYLQIKRILDRFN